MRFGFPAPAPLALAPLVAGHGAVTSYTIVFPWPDYNPTLQVSDIKMRCNGGSFGPALDPPIAAGQNITAVWEAVDAPAGARHGLDVQVPALLLLLGLLLVLQGRRQGLVQDRPDGACGGAPSWPPTTGAPPIVYKNLKWSSAIPKNLAPGNYLIRHELLALHQSDTPQFYAECAATPPPDKLYSIPVYAPQSDPGITIDIYSSKATSYTCPGGDVWSGFQF
ncbi:glycosylhydrolase family 61-8 protein [Diplogelasinospora grovesii]|uniref:lytic cellulose monooxygenase (C4-dehydrogenating) n=1 Tax=Diplogelasinospora grovesii TaxID=303347 RepID=A0AAN6NBU6_9PEZI|nr:glycosylhydrolase family 61-8 protein [Diplogelasinospora grovesii]